MTQVIQSQSTHWVGGGEEVDGLCHQGLGSSHTLVGGLGDHAGGLADAVHVHTGGLERRLHSVLQDNRAEQHTRQHTQ
jgi:hypothetical protein